MSDEATEGALPVVGTWMPPAPKPREGLGGSTPAYVGDRYALGYAVGKKAEAGQFFYALIKGMKVKERWSLSPEGWRQAWVRFAAVDPDGPARVRRVFEDRLWAPRFTLYDCKLVSRQNSPKVELRFANVGVELFGHLVLAGTKTNLRLPWDQISSVQFAGSDAIATRPSVAATLAFGIIGGMAARTRVANSYFVIATPTTEYVVSVSLPLTELQAKAKSYVPPNLLVSTESAGQEPGTQSSDIIEQIRRLGELRDAGVLTEDEFLAKKTDLLDRL